MNLETDYAIRIVHCLVDRTERLDAATISARTGVTPRFTLKILHKLVNAGLLRSFKGAKGGYLLARDPADITLKDVIEVIDGPIAITRCQRDGYVCDHPDNACVFIDAFAQVTEELAQRLDQITFAMKKK